MKLILFHVLYVNSNYSYKCPRKKIEHVSLKYKIHI